MTKSPFKYGVTVSNQAFTNREMEIEKLLQNLENGINTSIISPRRWGKSSLVEKVVNEINKQANTRAIIIDLFKVAREEEFLELFAREVIKASSTKWEEWVTSGKSFFKQLVPSISIGVDPSTDFSIGFKWEELKKHKDEILNLPEEIARKKNLNIIICLDEFQNLSALNDFENFEKRLRANWQRHKSVTYCLYGSKRHMMTDIFNNPSKPFYRFGDIMFLDKIKTEKWVLFIVERFESTGKSIHESLAEHIAVLMKNHSWYVQQLAHYTWQKTTNKATKNELSLALNELIETNIPLFQRITDNISGTQLNLIKAIIEGITQLTSAPIMHKYQLGTPNNVTKNKLALTNNEIIHDINGKLELLDPAFELWFLKQFFNQNYSNIE